MFEYLNMEVFLFIQITFVKATLTGNWMSSFRVECKVLLNTKADRTLSHSPLLTVNFANKTIVDSIHQWESSHNTMNTWPYLEASACLVSVKGHLQFCRTPNIKLYIVLYRWDIVASLITGGTCIVGVIIISRYVVPDRNKWRIRSQITVRSQVLEIVF